MKLGFAEIGVVIVIAIIIFAVVRMKRLGENAARENETPVRVRRRKSKEATKQVRHPRLQILGFIFILVAILMLLSNIGLARWVGMAPLWAIAIVAIGVVTILIARRR